MSRRHADNDDHGGAFGSFLDVVTNMVGILIILVMILGNRLKNAPVNLAPDERLEAATIDLKSDLAQEQTLRGDVLRLATEVQKVQQGLEIHRAARDEFLTMVTAGQHEIQQRRQRLTGDQQQEFDLEQQIRQSQEHLNRLKQELSVAKASANDTVELKASPTPLSKTVDGEELHFRLRRGRIAVVPFKELEAKCVADARVQIYKLRDRPQITETVGPVGGFCLRYTIAVSRPSDDEPETVHRRNGAVQLSAEFVPVTEPLGEPLDLAFAAHSEFRDALAAARPGRTTITLWIYGDSFGEFRRVKQELHQMGFTIAGWPRPDDVNIGFSPQGSKSAAE